MPFRTPFLPGISHLLCGRSNRSACDELRARTERLRRASLSRLCQVFGRWLPEDLFAGGPNSRQRSYPDSLTFWAFLNQVIHPECSCRQIVRKVQLWHRNRKQPMPSSRTGAYCQARARLPQASLNQAHEKLADQLAAGPQTQGVWKGHRLRVIDGTGLSMPDTETNQKAFPQPTTQAAGCGFPVVKLVAVFCLHTGALIRWVQGTLHDHENRLFKGLLAFFSPKDIVVADRGFCGFAQIAALLERGADMLVRQHQCRSVDWRKGQRLGAKDRLVSWERPYRQSDIFSPAQWAAFPREIRLRMLEINITVPGFRNQKIILVTTLLDAKRYPADELARLYLRRWSVEVFYRDIKQTMGMDILRCQSPAMIQKEIHLHAIAYNLIRSLMNDIARRYDMDVARLSFKGTLDALRQWQPILDQPSVQPRVSAAERDALYETIAGDPLPHRPNRSEPRAVKRRPKNFRLMTKPRHQMRVEPSRKQSQKPSKPCLN
jgi:hypothetical protein